MGLYNLWVETILDQQKRYSFFVIAQDGGITPVGRAMIDVRAYTYIDTYAIKTVYNIVYNALFRQHRLYRAYLTPKSYKLQSRLQ